MKNLQRNNSDGETIMIRADIMPKVEDRLYRTKKVMLLGPINSISADMAVKTLLSFPDSTDEVEIWIKSDGGSVVDGFALIDVMRTRKFILKTIGFGYVNSMAVAILASGTLGHRYVSFNTNLMLHELVWGSEGSATEMKIRKKQTEYLERLYIDLLRSTTNEKSKEFWDEFIKMHERWITAKEAIKIGIADKML